MRKLDVVFIHPGASSIIYQGLSEKFSSIETPTWSLLLAQSCRSKGLGVSIIDCDAEKLTHQETAERIKHLRPRLICIVVYGSNPNAGTTQMSGVVNLVPIIKEITDAPICVAGSHAQALPFDVLGIPGVDFILLNEGVYALQNLLNSDLKNDLQNIVGVGYNKNGSPYLNDPASLVPNDRMDIDMPGSAWDLLPMKNKPLDLYRSCNWHAEFIDEQRTPYAALYTSLGCSFKCFFCMINSVNRTNNDQNSTAADFNKMRFWSPSLIFKEIEKLYEMGVKTIRISDEMFYLNRKYFEPLLEKIAASGMKLKIWSYARVDTVRPKFLDLFREAGMNFLALGIESGNQKVRKEITKGTYEEVDVRNIVKEIRNHGINVIANYIFGLPDDDYDTMNQTLDLALELNTEMYNGYAAAALPGSPLYQEAIKKGWELPKSYSAWSFHSYDCVPLPTKYLSASEVLRFRDSAWRTYFTRPEYLSLIENKFGIAAREHVQEMSKIKLKRKILGD